VQTYQYPESALAGNFRDGIFVPSEEANKLLSYLKKRYNVPTEVLSLPDDVLKTKPGIRGAFYSAGVTPTGYGGSADPNRRVVTLAPKAGDLHTLAHEAGHAYDPVLHRSNVQVQQQRQSLVPNVGDAALAGQLTRPGEFLNMYIDFMGPRSNLHSETTAQKMAAEYLKDISSKHPERDQPWYQGYPKSFIDKGIGSATALMSIPSGPEQLKVGYVEDALFNNEKPFGPSYVSDFYGNVVYEPREDQMRRVLDLALDPEYRKTVNEIERRTQTYLDRELGKGIPNTGPFTQGMSYWGGS